MGEWKGSLLLFLVTVSQVSLTLDPWGSSQELFSSCLYCHPIFISHLQVHNQLTESTDYLPSDMVGSSASQQTRNGFGKSLWDGLSLQVPLCSMPRLQDTLVHPAGASCDSMRKLPFVVSTMNWSRTGTVNPPARACCPYHSQTEPDQKMMPSGDSGHSSPCPT